MSYQAVGAVLANSKAKGSERLVLLVVASHANAETFECHPGRDLLCQESAMSERNLIYCLKKLEESKELTINRGSGRGNLTIYRINLAKIEEKERVQVSAPFIAPESVQAPAETMQSPAPFIEEKVQFPAPFESDKGCNLTSERVQDLGERVQDSVEKGAKSGDAYKDIEPSGTKKKPPRKYKSGAQAPAASVPVQEVFQHWKTVLDHPRAILDAKRQKLIADRIEQGFSVDDLKAAIDGCRASPYHMGQNDHKTIYDSLELICRDASHVEQFIAKSKNGNGHSNGRQNIANMPAWKKQLLGLE